jgi:hypothetical protein
MAKSTKKKKSGRTRPEEKSESKPVKATPKPTLSEEHHSKREERSIAENDGEQLHSPWLPLIWMLIPLFACVAYGVMTR